MPLSGAASSNQNTLSVAPFGATASCVGRAADPKGAASPPDCETDHSPESVVQYTAEVPTRISPGAFCVEATICGSPVPPAPVVLPSPAPASTTTSSTRNQHPLASAAN